MRKPLQAKYIASEIHALLFIFMLGLTTTFSQPLMDGLSSLPFSILLVADLPISLVALGVMLTSSKDGLIAAALWGVAGTLWWFGIGTAIDARIRKYREKHSNQAESVEGTVVSAYKGENSHRKELLIACSAVAVVVLVGSAWQWNGPQGHFDKGKIGNFAFAPDGSSILMIRTQGGSSLLQKIALSSGESTTLGEPIPCIVYTPTYSPDGRKIALVCATETNERSRILVMDADGANLHPLFSPNSESYDFAPHFAWGADKIYFARRMSFAARSAGDTNMALRWDVFSASLDGQNAQPQTDSHFVISASGPEFSGDGRMLIFSDETSEGTRLYSYSLDDSTKSELVIQPSIPNGSRTPEIIHPLLSLDGRSIYFMASVEGKKGFDYDFFRFDIASKAVERLTSDNGYATDLCVSNDGKTAVFLRWTSRWGSLPNLAKLYTLNLATKRVSELNVTGTR